MSLLLAFLLGILVGYVIFGSQHDIQTSLLTGDTDSRLNISYITSTNGEIDSFSPDSRQIKNSSSSTPVHGTSDVIQISSGKNKWNLDANIGQIGMLLPGLVSNIVHYLWCERKIFEFQHYLSVLSVMKTISPDRIIFHYAHYPRHDLQLYNTWFEDMKKEFPFLDLDDLGNNSSVCSSTNSQRDYIYRTLHQQGGIYVHHNTIFFQFPLRCRQNSVTNGLSNGVEGFIVMHQGAHYDGISSSVEKLVCLPAEAYFSISNSNTSICAIKKGPYYPRNAWNRNDSFSQRVNVLLYDSPQTPVAEPSNTSLIPNIGHMIWFGGGVMSFLFYLSCLSQINILKVDTLYIHGDKELQGSYWKELKTYQNVVFVKIIKSDLIFRKNIKIVNHMADVYRMIIMIRYGGIYTDADAVWIKPIPSFLRQYDSVASYDWPQMYNVYPDYIQCGVVLSKPGARYWKLSLETLIDFSDNMYGYNGLLKPYKMLERHPDTLFIYDKLQVMCWKLRCHPTWYPDFRDKNADHTRYSNFNWRDANTFHWTDPTPDELKSEDALKRSNTMFAEIGKHILRASGKVL